MKKSLLLWLNVLIFSALLLESKAQTLPADTLLMPFPNAHLSHKKLLYGGGASYALGVMGLDRLWYAQEPRSNFHFFDDSGEWLQIDKAGHFYSSYHISCVATGLLLQTDMPRQKALWVGGVTGVILMTPIEILDGFSSAYGASLSDELANASGSALLLTQTLLWGELRIQPRWSYRPTHWAKYRPNILGSNYLEQSLKDYNGQTYWLSVNVRSFVPQAQWWPKWLCVAVGYGGDGMLGGHDNHWTDAKGQAFNYDHVRRYRQYYLSLDVDFTKIRTRKTWVRTLLYGLGHLHVPAPAFSWSKPQGLRGHWLYF